MNDELNSQNAEITYPDALQLVIKKKKRCAYIVDGELYLRLGASDDEETRDGATLRNLRVRVRYFDAGTETIQIGWSINGTSETNTATIVTKTNTNKWKTAKYKFAAVLGGDQYPDQEYGDVRIVSTGELYVEYVITKDLDDGSEFVWSAATNATALATEDSESDDYEAGTAGWFIDRDTGKAQFTDLLITGEIHTSVFVKDVVNVQAGTIMVAKSAGALAAKMNVPSAGTWTAKFNDPPGGGFLFANNDICYIKGKLVGGGIGATYFTVSARVSNGDGTQSYTCTWNNGTKNATYRNGQGVTDLGVNGDGYLVLTADAASGAPSYSVYTHSGSPWTDAVLRGRFGNLNGIVDATLNPSGYGIYTSNGFFSGTLTATTGAIGGFVIGTTTLTATNFVLDSANQQLRLGSGNNIIVADAADAMWRLWIGNAAAASASFRVAKDGKVYADQFIQIGSSQLQYDSSAGGVGGNPLLWVRGIGLDRLDVSTTGAFNLDTQGRSWIRLTGTATAKTISYIRKPDGPAGQLLILKNDAEPVTVKKTSQLTLKNNLQSPPAGYAAMSLYGKDVVLKNFGTVALIYDAANERWTLQSVVKATTAKKAGALADEGYDEEVSVTTALPQSTVANAGTIILNKSAGTLAVDMDIPASSTWTMELVTPSDGTTWMFANGETAYMRQGASEVYFTVTRGTNDGVTQTYTCTFANGTRPLSFAAGAGVINFGASGQGWIVDTVASGAPRMSIYTHSGSPWSPTEVARLGSLTGITDANFGALTGYGLWTNNVFLSGSINATAGLISGTLTVSGTLQNSAGNPRWQLNAAGFKQYDSGGVQRSQLLNDGSGWLGSSSVLAWTAAGVVSLNGSAVVGNSLDADKVTFTAPTLSGLTLTNNSPSAGYVAWSSFKLTYQGVTYTVSSGNSNNKYIYWKKSVSTTVLQTSATIPTNAPDMFIVVANFSGTAYQSNFAPFIYADYISVGQLSAISADMGSITAGTITGGTIRTAASGARTEMHASNLFGLGFGGIGGTDGTTAQWYAKASDGKLYAAGGDWVVDASGQKLPVATSWDTKKGLRWEKGGNVVSRLWSLSVDSTTNWTYLESVPAGSVTASEMLVASESSGTAIAIAILRARNGASTPADLRVYYNPSDARPNYAYVQGDLKTANGTYDLGVNGGAWRNAWVSGNVNAGGVLPYTNNADDIGSNSMRWQDVWIGGSGSVDIASGSGSRFKTNLQTAQIYVKSDKLVVHYRTATNKSRFYYITLTGTVNPTWTYSATEP